MTSSGRKIAKQSLDSFTGNIEVGRRVGVAYWKYADPHHIAIARRQFCEEAEVASVTPPWAHHPRSGGLTTHGARRQTERERERERDKQADQQTHTNASQFS